MSSHVATTERKLSKYVVQSSDVISDMRINITEEGKDKVIWYKERFLADDEIIEHIVENATSTICWSIHRPKRGWYIRVRAPSFPPGMFIPLLPVPKVSPNFADAAISFACRTSIPPSHSHINSRSSSSQLSVDTDITSGSAHSYPPSPPTPSVVLSPPSPQSIDAKLEELAPPKTLAPPSKKASKQQVTQFLLAPHSSAHVPQPAESSFFTRALAAFKNSKPSHSSSFTLSPISPPPPASPPAPSPPSSANSNNSHHIPHLPPRPKPLLVFHDHTPIMTVSSITGLLEIDEEEEKLLGVQTSFWIAIALTYLEFLGERDSYLAAVSD